MFILIVKDKLINTLNSRDNKFVFVINTYIVSSFKSLHLKTISKIYVPVDV